MQLPLVYVLPTSHTHVSARGRTCIIQQFICIVLLDLHNYANEGGVTDESKTCAHKQESNINIELILLAAPPMQTTIAVDTL